MLTEQRFAAFTAFFLPDIYALIDWTHTPIFLEQELRAITRKTKRGSGSVEERTMPHLSTAERIGRKEGRIEEAQEMILELLEVRFGTVAPDLTERIHAISSLPRLRKLRRMLFEGMTLVDFEDAVRIVKS